MLRTVGVPDVYRKYLVLTCLYGFLFGVRYTLEVWLIEAITPGAYYKFLLVSLAFLGMFAGEVLGARISDFVSRALAIKLGSLTVIVWCACNALAIGGYASPFLELGALSFGIALGIYHTSLDSWFDEATVSTSGVRASDAQLTAGFFFFNSAYLVSSVLAFPLLFSFNMSANLNAGLRDVSFPYLPHIMNLGICVAIIYISPTVKNNKVLKAGEANWGGFMRMMRQYSAILKMGGGGLVAAIVIGSLINFLVQYVDHFAPANLLPGETVDSKSLNIAILNATVLLSTGGLYIFLGKRRLVEKLNHKWRLRILSVSMYLVMLLIASAFLVHKYENYLTPLLLGLAQAILLALLPLMKAWVLNYSIDQLKATTLSILGISKRMIAMVTTLSLYFLGASFEDSKSTDNIEYIILFLTTIGCTVLILLSQIVVKHRLESAVTSN